MNYFNYFTEIEDTFVRRRGKHLLLSPVDWALIESWNERKVPLHVVLRAIESVFDNYDKSPGPRTIKSLMFCREEVEAKFVEWTASQVGRADETPSGEGITFTPESIREHIANASAQLRNVDSGRLREDLDRAAERLTSLAKDLTQDAALVDGSLGDIEKFLDEALLEKSDPEILRRIKNEVSNELKPYRKEMDNEAFDHTFRLMFLKRIREETGIPRLGLFYL